MKRSIPIHVPRPMTVTSVYGVHPHPLMLAERDQPEYQHHRIDVTPQSVELGWWVIQWDDDRVTVEPASDEEIDRWRASNAR